MIHKTAIIDPKAKIASNVEIGPYCVIGPNVEIGENTIIHSHVNISVNAKIGIRGRNFATLRAVLPLWVIVLITFAPTLSAKKIQECDIDSMIRLSLSLGLLYSKLL